MKLDRARLQFNIQRNVGGAYYDVQVCAWMEDNPYGASVWYRDLSWAEAQDVIEATMTSIRLGEVLDDCGATQPALW